MIRIRQAIFAGTVVVFSWYYMMLIHESGHAIGAWLTRGTIKTVVLHPLKISRTDVLPNPNPAVVAWLGPIFGCLFPCVTALAIPERFNHLKKTATFIAGFCLVANGAYIGFGAFHGIGDCQAMLDSGSPLWLLVMSGWFALALGLYVWHQLGAIRNYWSPENDIYWETVAIAFAILITLVSTEFVISGI